MSEVGEPEMEKSTEQNTGGKELSSHKSTGNAAKPVPSIETVREHLRAYVHPVSTPGRGAPDVAKQVFWGPHAYVVARGEPHKTKKECPGAEKGELREEPREKEKAVKGKAVARESDFAEGTEIEVEDGAIRDVDGTNLNIDDDVLFMTEQTLMPPPGTPRPEPDEESSGTGNAYLRPSLSQPTLPTCDPISDPAQVASYQSERAKNSAAFDEKTSKIQERLLQEKIHRTDGRIRFLEQGDYTVELASREEATKLDKILRKNQQDTADNAGALEAPDLPNPTDNGASAKAYGPPKSNIPKAIAGRRPCLPCNLGFTEKVTNYQTSGSLTRQHVHQVETYEHGTEIIITTHVSIQQKVFVPKPRRSGAGSDAVEAIRQSTAKRVAREGVKKKGEVEPETEVQDKNEIGKGKANVQDEGDPSSSTNGMCPIQGKLRKTSEVIGGAPSPEEQSFNGGHVSSLDATAVAVAVERILTTVEEMLDAH